MRLRMPRQRTSIAKARILGRDEKDPQRHCGRREPKQLESLGASFNEDAARNRAGHGPQYLALLRKIALNIVRADTEEGSFKGKLKRAGWDEAFLKSASPICDSPA